MTQLASDPFLSRTAAVLAHTPATSGLALGDAVSLADWRARSLRALSQLAETGRLDAPDALGVPLRTHVAALAEAPLGRGLAAQPGRAFLLGELLRNLARPGRINQGLKWTCAATCVEIHLAEERPGEYARLVAGLVGPDGVVPTAAPGSVLRRDEEALVGTADEARRSPVSRLFQAACMELAYPDFDYRNDRDTQLAGSEDRGKGLASQAFDRLLEALTGTRWDTLDKASSSMGAMFAKLGLAVDRVPDLARDAPGIIERTFAAGATLFATLEAPGARDPRHRHGPVSHHPFAHKIRLLAMDREAGRVVYDDPMDPAHPWFVDVETRVEDHEGRCSMRFEELMRCLAELNYQPCFADGASSGPPVR